MLFGRLSVGPARPASPTYEILYISPDRTVTVDSSAVTAYDIFNGDADGLCALRQLRLHEPLDAVLITGAKREIALVERAQAQRGDRLTVLDVSLNENRKAVLRALEAGATCLYFDHHYSGSVLTHPALETHIRCAPGVCTSLLVDEYLGGRYRAWAVAAAFGDNLPDQAKAAAHAHGLPEQKVETLRALGEYLNYNAYGDSVEDLHFNPGELYRRLSCYDDPVEFAQCDSTFETLREGYQADMARVASIQPVLATPGHWAALLPDTPWARRVSGPWANQLAASYPMRAHAVLVRKPDHYTVSVRAPLAHPTGADALCRDFASGGGRPSAAGINRLPEAELTRFLDQFQRSFNS